MTSSSVLIRPFLHYAILVLLSPTLRQQLRFRLNNPITFGLCMQGAGGTFMVCVSGSHQILDNKLSLSHPIPSLPCWQQTRLKKIYITIIHLSQAGWTCLHISSESDITLPNAYTERRMSYTL